MQSTMSQSSSLTVGTVINDRYVVESQLGKGGYSHVVAARDRSTDRNVALKLLHARAMANDPRAVQRLRQEAEILRAVNHPNIVEFYDVDTFEDAEFVVMEYVDGTGLDELLEQKGTLSTARLVPLVRQLLDALEAAHANGILHRDLKPQNILVVDIGGHEEIKLVDFGVAKASTLLNEEKLDDAVTLVQTRAGKFVGTPQYSAPEMVVGDPSSPATDLFCVGLIVYEALVGQPLIKGTSESELLNELVFPTPFDLSDVVEPWGQWLEVVLKKDPNRRIDSAAEALGFIDELFPDYAAETTVSASRRPDDALSQAETDEVESLHPRFSDAPPKTETEIDGPPDFAALNRASDVDIENAETVPMSSPQALEHIKQKRREAADRRAANGGAEPPGRNEAATVADSAPDEDAEQRPEADSTSRGTPEESSSLETLLLFIIVALVAFVVVGVLIWLVIG